MTVLGLDSCKTGWVAVAVDQDGFVEAFISASVDEAERVGLERWGVETLVIDIPIGLPDSGPRQADVQARAFIKPRHSSVFSTPVRAAVESRTYDEAREASIAATGGTSLSKQAWAITPKILEVDAHRRLRQARILEGHPEVSFRAMAGEPIEHYKKTLSGAMLRSQLLAEEGIELPRSPVDAGLRGADLDDLFDAGAMAWTALRVERGEAERLPAAPEKFSDGVDSAIWY